MKSLPKLLALAFLFPFLSNAQSPFKPGCYVNLKGDTIKGYINFHAPENNPEKLAFKTDTDSKSAIILSVRDTHYFNVIYDNRIYEYEKYAGSLTMNDINVNHLLIGRDSSFKTDTVFFKIVQKGKNLILFSYSDDFKTRYFISKTQSETPSELIFRLYYNSDESNGSNKTVYENTWQKQLYNIAVMHGITDEKFANSINKSDFNERDILIIVSRINNIAPSYAFKHNSTKAKPLTIALVIIAATAIIIVLINEFSSIHSR